MNLIFVTGLDGYQGQAMDLFASGYVKKPVTKEKIETPEAKKKYRGEYMMQYSFDEEMIPYLEK